MASLTIYSNPTLVTATNTNSTEITFDEESLGSLIEGKELAYIEVVSGSFNFNVVGTASIENGTFASSDKLILSFDANRKVSFKAASTSDSFKISF